MPRRRERVRLEDGLRLDLNRLMRDGLVKAGELTRRETLWNRIPSGELVAMAIIEADMRPDSPARITIEHGGRVQHLRLRPVARHFGGLQWFFVCQETGRRATVLWKPPGGRYFASREAFGRQVAYGSQFECPRYRALSAAQSIRHRLGGNEWLAGLNGFPRKPKGMRWATYDRLQRKCEAYERFSLASISAYLQQLKMIR
jgi:hypothetical protein